MSSPEAFNHSLLRPCVLHILRSAGYHSTRPSVLDALTDIAGRYLLLLATTTAEHAELNHGELEICITDVRMAMDDCGAFAPEKVLVDQVFDGEEDTRGVDAFLEWATGPENKEIRRVAMDSGDDSKEDYLTSLKNKHDKIGDESRYHGTILGKAPEPRVVEVEGGDITSLQEWAERLHKRSRQQSVSSNPSRRQSSELSSLEDQEMEGMDFS